MEKLSIIISLNHLTHFSSKCLFDLLFSKNLRQTNLSLTFSSSFTYIKQISLNL